MNSRRDVQIEEDQELYVVTIFLKYIAIQQSEPPENREEELRGFFEEVEEEWLAKWTPVRMLVRRGLLPFDALFDRFVPTADQVSLILEERCATREFIRRYVHETAERFLRNMVAMDAQAERAQAQARELAQAEAREREQEQKAQEQKAQEEKARTE